MPYPRLISIFISETFAERNIEMPNLEDIWSLNTMKVWSATHGWESDKDILELPESMLCLIAPDSQYRLQQEELLAKSDSPTEEPSKEVFNCSSSTEEEEVEKFWSLETEVAGGEGILKITNSLENKT
ncbi:hypothetical protein Hanom_Chr16g01451371 [Helianthus anomalus]